MATRGIPWTEGGWKVYTDTDFTTIKETADFPFRADLGSDSSHVRIEISGTGAIITISLSTDGGTFGDSLAIGEGDTWILDGLRAHTMRMTHNAGASVTYRVVAY